MRKSDIDEVSAFKADHRSNYSLSDFFNNFEDVSVNVKAINHIYRKKPTSFLKSLIFYSNFRSWAYSLISSVTVAIVCFAIERTAIWLLTQRKHHIIAEDYNSFFVWLISALILATASTGLCHIYGHEAQGAGVPELKCIITGSQMHEYLEFRVLIAKSLGMTLALGAGFITGRIGPNMHIGAMIFSAISKLPYFKPMRRDSVLRNQSLMIGAALGLSCTFGTPFTGLVLIVELAEKISSGRTMWILYVGLFFSTVTYKLLGFSFDVAKISALNHTWNDPIEELMEFGLLGIFCGFYGALFIQFMIWFQHTKNRYSFLKKRYTYTWISIITIAFLQFKFDILRIEDKTLLNDIYGKDNLDPKYFTHPNEVISLLILLFLKSVMFFLTITSPIPAGIFAPLMLMGGILGRMYGHILKILLGNVNISKYAVAAAAAVSAVTTRFLCMTVLVVEVTEDVNIIFLIMITVLFAYGTGNHFTKSFFSSNIELRKLPYCSKLMRHDIYTKKAKEIMLQPKIFLTNESNLQDMLEILKTGNNFSLGECLPIIEKNSSLLKGTIKVANMIKYLKNELKIIAPFTKQSWPHKMHIFLKVFGFLDEETEINGEQIIKRAERVSKHIKEKKAFQLKNFQECFKKHKKINEFELEDKLSSPSNAFDNEENFLTQDEFLQKKIDYEHECLNFDSSPLCINPEMNLCKIHFLFIGLGVSSIFICEQNILQGIIKKNYFLSLNSHKKL